MGKKKILTILGARPQFVKAAVVSRVIKRQSKLNEVILHTGQHYDANLSAVFLKQLDLRPRYNLGVGSDTQSTQTAKMMLGIERIIEKEKPDMVLVYGDTNSTLAGALAAKKAGTRLAHVEAGMRSFNRSMPEEANRVVADYCSDILFCSTPTAVRNLRNERVPGKIYLTGDVMYDSILYYAEKSQQHSRILRKLGLENRSFCLVTIHRAENTENVSNLRNILKAFADVPHPVIFPCHPRTRKTISRNRLRLPHQLRLMEPVSYLDMLRLESTACAIFTDSGGVQKEAFFLGKPCVVLRNETEWVEIAKDGRNILSGLKSSSISKAIRKCLKSVPCRSGAASRAIFGDGKAAHRIVRILLKEICG